MFAPTCRHCRQILNDGHLCQGMLAKRATETAFADNEEASSLERHRLLRMWPVVISDAGKIAAAHERLEWALSHPGVGW